MRVLIVEDEQQLADAVARGLRREGMAVDVAYDGDTGHEKSVVTRYDVVVLDRDLPGMHGDQLCAELVASGALTRVLMLTASGSASIHHRAIQGEVAVDLVDGVVGVPLKISGTLDDPALSLTGGALAGAAVGTAVLPGVGTAIGARIGQQVERIFGGGAKDDRKNDPKKSRPKGPRAP